MIRGVEIDTGIKLRRVIKLLLLTLSLSVAGPVPVMAEYMDSVKAAQLRIVQDYIYSDDFVRADSVSGFLTAAYPRDPAGYFGRSATLLARMFDSEESSGSEEFQRLLDTIETLAGGILDTADRPTAAWMHLYLGHARSNRALWESHFGSFARALRLGFGVKGDYRDGLESDSTCYDLYFGLGLYHYWKSAKGGIFRRLRILKNEMGKGIEELYLAADSSRISRTPARNALILVWLDRGEYDSTIAICNEMLARYPDGRVFLWPLARAHFEKRSYRKALEIYDRLRRFYAARPGNYYNLLECDYEIYNCRERLNMEGEARATARQALSYFDEIPEETRQRQRDKLRLLKRAASL